MSDLHCRIEQEIPRLRRYARGLTRASDRADDLVQDTLVRALAKLHLWQPGTDIRAWLFTIMHHQYVNTVRREAREGMTVDIERIASTMVATTNPTARRQLVELDQALARLPAKYREVLLLVGLEGMDYESAAQILGVPTGTVRSRLSPGRERLRELMGSDRRLGHSPDKEATTRQPNTDAAIVTPRDVTDACSGISDPCCSAVRFVGSSQVGKAAWYNHVGKPTATGEILDRVTATAAHRSLPLASCARVTNLDNGRSVVVKINDRGPYTRGRILDLSPRAADGLP